MMNVRRAQASTQNAVHLNTPTSEELSITWSLLTQVSGNVLRVPALVRRTSMQHVRAVCKKGWPRIFRRAPDASWGRVVNEVFTVFEVTVILTDCSVYLLLVDVCPTPWLCWESRILTECSVIEYTMITQKVWWHFNAVKLWIKEVKCIPFDMCWTWTTWC